MGLKIPWFLLERWNAKNMFVYYVPSSSYPATTKIGSDIAIECGNNKVPYRAYLAIKTGNGTVAPWSISNSDVLEEDWEVIL